MKEGIRKIETTGTKYLQIERKSPEILALISESPVYKKVGEVHARPAVEGEIITTTLSSGEEETSKTAKSDEFLVTNATGEQYLIPRSVFLERYQSTDQVGIYTAHGFCKAVPNPYGKPIEILASWGSPQRGDESCFIADTCDADGKLKGEPYLIAAEVFAETYTFVKAL